MPSKGKYQMPISRKTVDRLGIKLYDKVSASVGELIANSYDADATEVKIHVPLNRWLAKKDGTQVEEDFTIIIEDDGIGMVPDDINTFYLPVGKERRSDERGDKSPHFKRPVMGRKGIGKLAPFGICKKVEVISSGGEETKEGFFTAHLILDIEKISEERKKDYEPDVGELDETYLPKRGTKIILSEFIHRRTPEAKIFHRQIARRFGINAKNWKIKFFDTVTGEETKVGDLQIDKLGDTNIDLSSEEVILDDGTHLPVRGWMALSRNPYKDPEMAGVRIYSRGKLVSQTKDFGINAGFTGEHTIRSYLVGEIHIDWLEDGEDLIRTDRQDILWNSDMGIALKQWGQKLVKKIGRESTAARHKRNWEIFFEKSNIQEHINRRFNNNEIREQAVKIAKTFGAHASPDFLDNEDSVENLRELCLSIAPHKIFVDSLHEIAQSQDYDFSAVTNLFSLAYQAELASLGQSARERIDAIATLEESLNDKVLEHKLQYLLERSPWLINPEWTLFSSNKSLENTRNAFERYYKEKKGVEIVTTSMKEPSRRPDFILSCFGGKLQLVEIKPKGHELKDDEFERIRIYYDALNDFLNENTSFKEFFNGVKITLICDRVKLKPTIKIAFDSLKEKDLLKHRTWEEILDSAKKANEDFLEKVSIK